VHATQFRRVPAAIVLCALGARTAAAQAPSSPQVSVGGLAYLQYVYQLKDTANHQNNFDITRAYINVNLRFASGVTARITPDIYRAAPDNSLRYRVKYAYATWTPNNSPLTLKLGVLHTPWLDWEDALWDYRMQGTLALNRNSFVDAADIGAGVDGKWGPDKVNMQVTVVNGEGFSGGPGDQRKDVMGRVSVRVMDTDDSSRAGGLRVTAYGQYGKPTSGGHRQRWLAMVSYRSTQLTLAAEAAITRDTVTATPLVDTNGHVYSAFGVYRVPRSKVAVIARVDVFDPQAGVSNDRQTRFIGGVSYQLSPNLRLLADWDYLDYQGTPTAAQEATRSQALFQTQVTF
jgi:porin-like protein